jgi:tetrahydromethanopterin S-methyltransferase subunit B
MTAAQKTAKANFKKAIEYRKKTGVSLKEAFAHVYGKKVGAAPKKKVAKKAAPKKAAKKVVKKAAPKKAAKKKHTKYGVVKKHVRRVAGVKKKVSEKSILNKIHKVKDQVSQLDELQHKHMSKIGALSSHVIHEVKEAHDKLIKWQKVLLALQKEKLVVSKGMKPVVNMDIKRVKEAIREQKTHIAQLKKHIK